MMLPLSEIRRLKETVDAEWRSAVADDVAAAWGLAVGSARWWRSSASHVFAVPGDPRRYLRFVPVGSPAAVRLRHGAELAARFAHADGLMIARPLPAESGELVPIVETPMGPMAAMLVEDVGGAAVDVSSLSSEQARRWGAALARFHLCAPPTDRRDGRIQLGDDAELTGPISRLEVRLDDLETRSPPRVTVHGDFELDNLRFTDDGIAVFDLDESAHGSAAADVALATRALRGDEGGRVYPELFEEFLAGYRSVREFTEEEGASVPVHALRYSARRALDRSMLDEGHRASDPQWQRELHDELVAAAGWHRGEVLAAAP